MIEYVCPHWGNPFYEMVFKTFEDAKEYAEVFEKLSGHQVDIEEREVEEE